MVENLFVYGSLKPGGWASRRLEGHVENPRDAVVNGVIHNINGSYPALDPRKEGEVQGIVYDVLQGDVGYMMEKLDALEGYPMLFNRDNMVVTLADSNETISALVYYAQDEMLLSYPIVETGVWQI